MNFAKTIVCILIIALGLCACSNITPNNKDETIPTDDIVYKTEDDMLSAINEMIDSGKYPLDSFLEDDDYCIFSDSQGLSIINKSDRKLSKVTFENPKLISTFDSSLYLTENDSNVIYSLNLPSQELSEVYVCDNTIAYCEIMNNGNLLITKGKNIFESETEVTDEQIIFNPKTKKEYAASSKTAYAGDGITVRKSSEQSTIYYDNQKYVIDSYILDEHYYKNSLFYFHDVTPEKTISLYKFKPSDGKEEFLKEYDIKIKDNTIPVFPLGLYSYKDRLFLEFGINAIYPFKGNYKARQFVEIDESGNEIQQYPVVESIDNAYYNFFNNRIYYNDLDDNLNYIEI